MEFAVDDHHETLLIHRGSFRYSRDLFQVEMNIGLDASSTKECHQLEVILVHGRRFFVVNMVRNDLNPGFKPVSVSAGATLLTVS